MPYLHEKVPRISPPSQAQLSLPNDRLCVYALGKDVAPRRGKLVVGAGEPWYNPAIATYQMIQYVDWKATITQSPSPDVSRWSWR